MSARVVIWSRDGRPLLVVGERMALAIFDALEGRVVVADEAGIPVDLLAIARRNPGAVGAKGRRS